MKSAHRGGDPWEAKDLVANAMGRVRETVERVVRGMTQEQLLHRPVEGANSVAWLVWHLARVQDHHLSDLAGRPQAWVGEGWHRRFGMPPDPLDVGTGHTPVQVAALKPDEPDALLAYFDAVYQRTLAYLQTVSAADLDIVLDEPQYQPMPTVGVRLVSVVNDNTQHAGQAAYLRGLILGKEGGAA